MNTMFSYNDRVLTPYSMCLFISFTVFIGTLFILFCRTEAHDDDDDDDVSSPSAHLNLLNVEEVDKTDFYLS